MPRGYYRWYVLGVLTSVYTLNYVDQGLMGLLLQPIKVDLHLSDSQLGFLTGIAFALFYATLGLPIARWADRGNRASIASLAIALWGLTVMLSLCVGNFLQMMAARIAAAIGESGCMPPTYSLLGDYFPEPSERTKAMAIYMLATPMAGLISFIGGGWLNDHYGWRMTFFLMGIPALFIAAVVRMTVAEPRGNPERRSAPRREASRQSLAGEGAAGPKVSPPATASLTDVASMLWRQHSTRHLIIGLILLLIMASGIGAWNAAFMMRSYGMKTGELGLWLGLIFGLGGMLGTSLGGYVCGRWFAANERRQVRTSAIVIASLVPLYFVFLLTTQRNVALAVLVPMSMASNFFVGPTFALLQRLVPNEARATTLAIVMLLGNLIGMGIGPQLVGIASDLLYPSLGADSLRYALLAMSFVAWATAYHFWRTGLFVERDLISAAAGQRSNAPSSPCHA